MKDILICAGSFIQIAGILCAAIGIRDVRRDFNTGLGIVGLSKKKLEPITRPIDDWLHRRHIRHRAVPAQLSGKVASSFGAVVNLASGRIEMPQTELGKIEWLVRRVTDLDAEIVGLKHQNKEFATEFASAKESAAIEHRRIEHESRGRVTALAASGLRLQTWGVSFLITGSILLLAGGLAS